MAPIRRFDRPPPAPRGRWQMPCPQQPASWPRRPSRARARVAPARFASARRFPGRLFESSIGLALFDVEALPDLLLDVEDFRERVLLHAASSGARFACQTAGVGESQPTACQRKPVPLINRRQRLARPRRSKAADGKERADPRENRNQSHTDSGSWPSRPIRCCARGCHRRYLLRRSIDGIASIRRTAGDLRRAPRCRQVGFCLLMGAVAGEVRYRCDRAGVRAAVRR